MLPEGVTYHASWIDRARMRCFQIMEASDIALVNQWANRWADLIDFEIIPIQSSTDFWADIPRS